MTTLDHRDALGTVVTTLTSRCWTNGQLDRELRDVLDGCLAVIGGVAVAAYYRRERVMLVFARRRVDEDGLARRLRSRLQDLRAPDLLVDEIDDMTMVVVPICETPPSETQDASYESSKTIMGYCALLFAQLPGDPVDRTRFITFHGRSSAGVLFQVLQHRVRLFLPFAPRVAERYWSESAHPIAQAAIAPPWQANPAIRRTVSLGFDLRKSTFCMENADRPEAFAEWLDQLVQILMAITHLYGGVFDKFTGDGVLVHFLADACELVDGRNPVTAGVLAAVAMQHASSLHLVRLRTLLRLDSSQLGGAIGVDIADAHWSLDHRHNPIIVGRGVVNACRVMDSAPAGGIRLTNIAYYSDLPKPLRDLFVLVPFTSKEFDAAKGINAWEMLDRRTALTQQAIDEVDAICQVAWKRSKAPIS